MAMIEYLKKKRGSAIYEELNGQFQNFSERLTLSLAREASGYKGKELVLISENSSSFEAPHYKGRDPTRFPARIKVMATVLQNRGCFGHFEIRHDNGRITVVRQNVTVILPKLVPSGRDREYKERSFDEVCQIVQQWLFTPNSSHRAMDRDLLGLDPEQSKGYQSLGTLHFLGLHKGFKGIFAGLNLDKAITAMRKDGQDFESVIDTLEGFTEGGHESVADTLVEKSKKVVPGFEDAYRLHLEGLTTTDGKSQLRAVRREQAALRAIVFGTLSSCRCAMCHRIFPVEVMVAAHIKPRYKCNNIERKNSKIVMPLCKIGCDDLYEKGYITVDSEGKIRLNAVKELSPDLRNAIQPLSGKICLAFDSHTAPFFAYRHDMVSVTGSTNVATEK